MATKTTNTVTLTNCDCFGETRTLTADVDGSLDSYVDAIKAFLYMAGFYSDLIDNLFAREEPGTSAEPDE
jgi:hypothetical protein